MENPAEDIVGVIHALTQSSPEHQQLIIRKYFLPDAAFTHPFCRVDHAASSRWWIEKIYRWYKIMSPRIEIQVRGVAFDEKKLLLFAKIHQIFKIWAIPFHKAPVDLVTVLELVKYTPPAEDMQTYAVVAAVEADKPKPLYFIKSQEDLYQTNEFVKFISVFRFLGVFIFLWQWFATFACAIGTFVFWPITWIESNAVEADKKDSDASPRELIDSLVNDAITTSHESAQKLAKKAQDLTSGFKARLNEYS